MSELRIEDGDSVHLPAGDHHFDTLRIAAGGSLTFDESVTLAVGAIVAAPGARIAYAPRSATGQRSFVLLALDAAGLTGLTLIGDGAEGLSHPPASPAQPGLAGDRARAPGADLPQGAPATAGGHGWDGAPGGPGGSAAAFTLYLPDLPRGAAIELLARGGRGGRGQDGGEGGAGGEGSALPHLPGARGGDGGDGGNGGRGGDAARTRIFIVAPDADVTRRARREALRLGILFRSDARPGRGGEGGLGGAPGPGLGAPGTGRRGCPGANGRPGASGRGAGRLDDPDWARIEVMSEAAFIMRLAARSAEGGERDGARMIVSGGW